MPPDGAEQVSVQSASFLDSLQRAWSSIEVQGTAFLMVISIGVGLITGLVAVLFIKAIGWITYISFDTGLPQFLAPLGSRWVLLVPVIGSLISGPMIAYWAMEAKGHGVPEVMQAIITEGGRIRPRVAVVKSLASSVCIGTGGSAGREGPIVQVGAALGSTFAQVIGLGRERTITLVACGAAAGIAATFNAPIAGVIFAMEVIVGEFTTHYFGMVVVSAVAASIVSRHFLGANPAFEVPTYTLVSPWELIPYAILGVLAALIGWSFVTVLYFLEDRFDPWSFPDALKPAIGAIPVGIIALRYPQALGTGLPAIEQALKGALPWTLLLVLIFAKLIATSFTLGSGNSGGIFSPSLFMGAMLGGTFGHWTHTLFPTITADTGAYALVGMASVFAAAAHAPLTAVLIVFEMSGDYRMILPLMITVGLSTLLSQFMRGYSIYTWKLVKRGIPLERDRDVDVMQGVTVGEVMTQQPEVLYADMSLEEMADVITHSRLNGFPVLDRDGRFVGVATIQDLERATAEGPIDGRTVAEIMQRNVLTVHPDDPLSKALRCMSDRDIGRLPVVDPQDPTRLVGFLRRRDVIRAYRHAILHKLENQHRDESLRLGHLTNTEIIEIPLSPGMPAVGRRIQDLHLPSQALITSIRRDDRIIIAHGETLLQPGDTVVALVQHGAEDGLRKALTGEG
ncbi:MAG: CBS domain-containing protein [Chloroflexi bacterium]|nr:MAG: CBS domain-containing protein [Chloroflexota bacterium]